MSEEKAKKETETNVNIIDTTELQEKWARKRTVVSKLPLDAE